MDILGENEAKRDELVRVLDDMGVVLDTVEALDGGTKSRIHSQLPERLSADLGTDELVSLLRVLEAYDLIALDGNTWVPGPGSDG